MNNHEIARSFRNNEKLSNEKKAVIDTHLRGIHSFIYTPSPLTSMADKTKNKTEQIRDYIEKNFFNPDPSNRVYALSRDELEYQLLQYCAPSKYCLDNVLELYAKVEKLIVTPTKVARTDYDNPVEDVSLKNKQADVSKIKGSQDKPKTSKE